MSLVTHRKVDIAVEQLVSSIELFEQENFFPAATLASAAEEVLGGYVKLTNQKTSLDSFAVSGQKIHRALFGIDTNLNSIRKMANNTKNSIKHLDNASDLHVSIDARSESEQLIWRAIDNNELLNLPYNETISCFRGSASIENAHPRNI